MSIETLDGAALEALPSIEEMIGLLPDLTGGLSLRDFLEDSE